eukprot:12299025-Alexandrium_andersonii.AAC.1
MRMFGVELLPSQEAALHTALVGPRAALPLPDAVRAGPPAPAPAPPQVATPKQPLPPPPPAPQPTAAGKALASAKAKAQAHTQPVDWKDK